MKNMEKIMQPVSSKQDAIMLIIEQLQQCTSDEQRLKLIEHMTLELQDLKEFHYFAEHSYGRNLVFSNEQFEIILMCWGSGQGATVHDHNDSLCIMKCLAGQLEEQRYVRKQSVNGESVVITPSTISHLNKGEACSITDSDGLHSISNQTDNAACSLHFYFPPIHTATVYDIKDGAQRTVTSAFTSEYGIRK